VYIVTGQTTYDEATRLAYYTTEERNNTDEINRKQRRVDINLNFKEEGMEEQKMIVRRIGV